MRVVLFVFLALVATSLAQPLSQDHFGEFIESSLAGDHFRPGEICKPSCQYITEAYLTDNAESGLEDYVGNCYCTPCWCTANSTLNDEQSRCSAMNSAALECKVKYERQQEGWVHVTQTFATLPLTQYIYTPDPQICFKDNNPLAPIQDVVQINNQHLTTVSLMHTDYNGTAEADVGTSLDYRCNSRLYVKAPYVNGQGGNVASAAKDRSIFGQYWDLVGNSIASMYGNSLTIDFNPPIDGVGMYLRDSSTSVDDAADQPRIIKITAANATGHLLGPELNTNFQGAPEDQGVRRADLLYFYYLQTSCDDVHKIASLTFTELDNEDSFSIDDITFFSQGSRCDPGTISGHVYSDVDQDGIKDIAETGIADVEICIHDSELGCDSVASACTTTSQTGYYAFTNVAPNTEVHICQRQCNVPDSYWDGIDTPGSLPGSAANNMSFGTCNKEGHPYPDLWDYFSGVRIGWYENEKAATNYNFGEIPRQPCEENRPNWCYFNPESGSLADKQSHGAASSGNPYTITVVSTSFPAASIAFGDEDENCRNADGENVIKE